MQSISSHHISLKNRFNIGLPFTPGSPTWSLPFTSFLPYVLCASTVLMNNAGKAESTGFKVVANFVSVFTFIVLYIAETK